MSKLLYMSLSNLMFKYLVHPDISDNPLNETTRLLVVSRHIIASVNTPVSSRYDTNNGNFTTTSNIYQSKYDNVDFIKSLYPNPSVLDRAYSRDDYDDSSVMQEYFRQMDNVECYTDILSIVQMLTDEDNVSAILVCADFEMKLKYLEFLSEYLEKEFGLLSHSFDEWNDNHNVNIGDVKHIKEKFNSNLEIFKASNSDMMGFFNKLTSNIEEHVRQKLERLSIDELVKFGNARNLYINRRRPKDYIIDIIIDDMYDKSEII